MEKCHNNKIFSSVHTIDIKYIWICHGFKFSNALQVWRASMTMEKRTDDGAISAVLPRFSSSAKLLLLLLVLSKNQGELLPRLSFHPLYQRLWWPHGLHSTGGTKTETPFKSLSKFFFSFRVMLDIFQDGYLIAGVESEHDNGSEDRR